MTNNKIPGVIVLGGHVQGLGIVRIYGKNGIPVILLDDTINNIARYSKYCKKFYQYKKEELLDFLLNLSNKVKDYQGWLLIPTNDYHVKVLSQNHEQLSNIYKVSTDKWDSVSYCYNKILTYKKARELDVLIPETFFPESIEDIKNINIEFPCIIKPAVMHEFYDHLKKKVFICRSRAELIHFYKEAIRIILPEQVIVQEIIEGKSENQYSACFNIQENIIYSHLVARRKRQHPLDFGNATTFAELVGKPNLKISAERILKSINYNGICEVEFKKSDKNGKYYFLEINPRTWKWHAIAEKANVFFLMNLYNFHNKLPIQKDQLPDYPICWQHIVTDFPTILKQLFKGQFKMSKCHKKQFAVYDIKDPIPFLMEIFLLPILIFKR